MDNYYDEDDMVIDSHEYPDPDLYAPQVPWVHTSGRIFGGHDPNIDPMLYENSGAADSSQKGEEYSDTEEGEEIADGNDSFVDPYFQEDDDSGQSDLFVSEADSDLDESTLEDRNNEMEQIKTSRKSRGGAAIDSSYFTARRGRGRGHGGSRGRGRGGKGMKRGIRKPLEPSFEFKQLHSQATTAFLEQNYAAAEDFAKQAIQLNPEIFTIYSLLSEVHMARGDKNRAMHALFNGAHTRPRDTILWCKVAKMIIEVAGDERQTGIPDAIYCYSRVLSAESSHVEARYERAALHREMGSKKLAAHDYIRLLRYLPHDTAVLRHLAEVFIDLGESTRAIEYYDKSIAYYQSLPPGTEMNFSWSDLNIYAELFMSSIETSMFTTALFKVKRACRWLLGRSEETIWDRYNDDDREFDTLDLPRREEIAEYVANTFPIDTYGAGLPLELRVKLGLFRLRLGEEHFDEAMRHFLCLEPEATDMDGKVYDFSDLFREVADALRLHGYFNEALQFYNPLQLIEDQTDDAYFSSLASCYEALQMFDEAEECIKYIIKYDEDNLSAWTQAATMFESANMPERAAPYIDKVISLRRYKALQRKREREANPSSSLPVMNARQRNYLSSRVGRSSTGKVYGKSLKRQLQVTLTKERVQTIYLEMTSLKQNDRLGHAHLRARWMEGARALLAEFRLKKSFFPVDRTAPLEATARNLRKEKDLDGQNDENTGRLQSLLADFEAEDFRMQGEYLGIRFEKWLDTFLEYAIFLAQDGKKAESYDIFETVYRVNIWYQSKDSISRMHIVWLTCALILDDPEAICNVSRYFMRENQFATDAYRLYAAINRLCRTPNSFYNADHNQKYLARQIRATDHALSGSALKARSVGAASYTSRDEAGNPIIPTEMNVQLVMLYGHVLYCTGSYAYAINYFYRAYALEPNNDMVNLSLALAYIHLSFKRQSENRHFLIMQGFSFLFTYYDSRKTSRVPSERQEAEYNIGRTYHMLGLTHLAIPYYERCLAMSEEVRKEYDESVSEDFSIEAAFALQGIYSTSGEMELAQRVTRKWLVM